MKSRRRGDEDDVQCSDIRFNWNKCKRLSIIIMHEPVYGIDCNNRTFRIRNCVRILGLQSSFVANVFQIGLSQKSGYNRIISDANIFTTIISFAPFIKWLTNLWHCKLPIHIQTHATHRACAQQPNSPQFMFRCFGVRLIACTYYQHEIAMDRK